MGVWNVLNFNVSGKWLSLFFRKLKIYCWLNLSDFDWFFEIETWFFDFFIEELNLLSHFNEEAFAFGVILIELLSSGFFQSFSWFNKIKFIAVKLESWEDCSQCFLGELFSFDGFNEIWEIKTFEFFHSLDKGFVLYFPEDGEGLGEFINGFDNIGWGLGEFFPIDVSVFSNSLKNVIEVLLDSGNVNLAHVEKIF